MIGIMFVRHLFQELIFYLVECHRIDSNEFYAVKMSNSMDSTHRLKYRLYREFLL